MTGDCQNCQGNRLGINSQAARESNPLKRVEMRLRTCFSRFEGFTSLGIDSQAEQERTQ
jgi:hypothetical protein